MRRSQVAHIIHIEAQERTHFGLLQHHLGPRQSFLAQAIEVDPLLPIYCHRSEVFDCQPIPPK